MKNSSTNGGNGLLNINNSKVNSNQVQFKFDGEIVLRAHSIRTEEYRTEYKLLDTVEGIGDILVNTGFNFEEIRDNILSLIAPHVESLEKELREGENTVYITLSDCLLIVSIDTSTKEITVKIVEHGNEGVWAISRLDTRKENLGL